MVTHLTGPADPGDAGPPEHWPKGLRDDAERMLRDVAKEYQDGVAGLRTRYRGVKLELDRDPARAWLARRLMERLFPGAEVLVMDSATPKG